jgi:hypothetical protein
VRPRLYGVIINKAILPFVFYGCETWTVILRAEQELKAFDKRVLRRVHRSLKEEVATVCRKLHVVGGFIIYKISYYSDKIVYEMGAKFSTNRRDEKAFRT